MVAVNFSHLRNSNGPDLLQLVTRQSATAAAEPHHVQDVLPRRRRVPRRGRVADRRRRERHGREGRVLASAPSPSPPRRGPRVEGGDDGTGVYRHGGEGGALDGRRRRGEHCVVCHATIDDRPPALALS